MISTYRSNESPVNNHNQTRISYSDLINTPNSNEIDFFNSCNSVEMSFDDNDHLVFNHSKYFNIMELHDLRT